MKRPLLFAFTLAATLLLSQGGLRADDSKAPRKSPPLDSKQEDSKGRRSSDSKGPRPWDSKGPRRRQAEEETPRADKRPQPPASKEMWEKEKAFRFGTEAEDAEVRGWAQTHQPDQSTPEGLFLAWKASILRQDRKAFFKLQSKPFLHRYYIHGLGSEIRPIDRPRFFYAVMFARYLGETQARSTSEKSHAYFVVLRKKRQRIRFEILAWPILREGGEWKIDGREVSPRFLPASLDLSKIPLPPRPLVGEERRAEIQKKYRLISEAEEAQALREAKAHKADFSTPQALFTTWRASILRRDRRLFLSCLSADYTEKRYPQRELAYIKHVDYLKYFYLGLSARFAKVGRTAKGETLLWITFTFLNSQTKLPRTQTSPFRVLKEGGRWVFQEL